MSHEVTRILKEWRDGDRKAAERLFPLVYEQLRQRAKFFLDGERNNHTLQPTALVHEVYLKMVDDSRMPAEDRSHFYAIASRVMRQILVDHARRNNAEKRGGSLERVTFEESTIIVGCSPRDIIGVDEALNRLEQVDQRKARVVEMRFFGGLTEQEIAATLGVTQKTVQRDWQFAKIWLFRELSNGT